MRRTLISFAVALVSLAPVQALAAFDWNAAYHSVNYTSQYYDLQPICQAEDTSGDDGGSDNSGTVAVASGDLKQRQKEAFTYFVRAFLNKKETSKMEDAEVWAAAIVGNLTGESNVRPDADNPAAKAGGGGIAQWEGGRWSGPDGLLAFVKKYNAANKDTPGFTAVTWKDFGVQLDFLWHELHNGESGALRKLKTYHGAAEVKPAARSFMLEFERPDPRYAHTEGRQAYAQQVYNDFHGTVKVDGADDTPAPTKATPAEVVCDNTTADADSADTSTSNDCPKVDGKSTDAGSGKGYKQGKETTVKLCKLYGGTINATIATGFAKLHEQGKKDGISLTINSGFRTMDQQISLRTQSCGSGHYNVYEKPSSQCSWPVARPGYSNHQMGEAIDFDGISIHDPSNPRFIYLKNGHGAAAGLKNLPSESWHWSRDGK